MPSKTLPALPVTGGGLLDRVLRTWSENDWDPAVLGGFRMDAGDGGDDDDEDIPEFEGLSDEELDAIEEMSQEDIDALEALPEEDLKKLLTGNQESAVARAERRVREVSRESATRRRELKPWKDLAKEYGMTVDEVREHLDRTVDADDRPARGDKDRRSRSGPDRDRDDRRRRDRDRSERLRIESEANRRIVRSEVKAIAADLFADPQDAPLYLKLDDYDVDEDGEVDVDMIRDDLKAVLDEKPHLAKSTERKRPKPDRGQGNRRTEKDKGVDAGRERFEARHKRTERAEKAS